MISDVLFEVVDGLDHYLNDPLFDDVYTGELRERLLRVRAEVEAIRRELGG